MGNESTTYEVVLHRTFKASREKVFSAWTDPRAIAEWFGPAPGGHVDSIDLNLRVGGSYRFVYVAADGSTMGISGVYTEVVVPNRLAFTWKWESSGLQPDETTISIDFIERGQETEIVLTHQKLSSTESKEAHAMGWSGCLEGFARYVESK